MLTGSGGNIGLSVGKSGDLRHRRPVRPAHRQDPRRHPGDHARPGPVRGQHALARRPHRRQREPGQGRGAPRRPRERAPADEHRAVHGGHQPQDAALARGRAPRGHLHRRGDLPLERRRDPRLPRAPRPHRRRRDRALRQGGRRAHGRRLLQRRLPVRRHLERRPGRRRDRGGGPCAGRDRRRDAHHPRPRAARAEGRPAGLPGRAQDAARPHREAQGGGEDAGTR